MRSGHDLVLGGEHANLRVRDGISVASLMAFCFLFFDVAPSPIDIYSEVPSQKCYHSIHSHEISLSPRSRVSCREHADEIVINACVRGSGRKEEAG